MISPVTPVSERLETLIHQSWLRNFMATALHYDAAGISDCWDRLPASDGCSYDRYVRGVVEGGVCCRDATARRSAS